MRSRRWCSPRGDYDEVQTDAPFVQVLRSVLADCSVYSWAMAFKMDM